MDILCRITTKFLLKTSFIYRNSRYCGLANKVNSDDGKDTKEETQECISISAEKEVPAKCTSKSLEKEVPIIALHDVLGSKKSMASICGDLAKSGYSVLSLNALNHGGRPRSPLQNYDWMAGDIHKYIKKYIKQPEARIIGHGMGGKIGIYLALAQPESVRSLVVIDTTPFTHASSCEKLMYRRILDAMLNINFTAKDIKTGVSEARYYLTKVGLTEDEYFTTYLLSNVVKKPDGTIGWQCNVREINENLDAILGFEFDKYIIGKKNWLPTLCIAGEYSSRISVRQLLNVKDLFPNTTMCLIKGAGNNVMKDAPEAVANIVVNFYKEQETIHQNT